MFPLILLQAKAVRVYNQEEVISILKVSINSPSGEGGEIRIMFGLETISSFH